MWFLNNINVFNVFQCIEIFFKKKKKKKKKIKKYYIIKITLLSKNEQSGIRTHASEEITALT